MKKYHLMDITTGELTPTPSGEFPGAEELILVEEDDGLYTVRDFDGEALVSTFTKENLVSHWERARA